MLFGQRFAWPAIGLENIERVSSIFDQKFDTLLYNTCIIKLYIIIILLGKIIVIIYNNLIISVNFFASSPSSASNLNIT